MAMLSKHQQGLRDFTDALRVCLGKDPLYNQRIKLESERFLQESYGLASVPDEWFRPKAVADLHLHGRDESVLLAERRKTLRAGHRLSFERERKP